MVEVIIRNNVLEGVKDPVGYQAFLDAELAARPMKDWERAMAETDAKLPRYVEDILDALDKPTRDKIAKKTMDAYDEKKKKRSEKP